MRFQVLKTANKRSGKLDCYKNLSKLLRVTTATLLLTVSHNCSALKIATKNKVLDLKIATSGLTRLSVENDFIDRVYVLLPDDNMVKQHETGNVFIAPEGMDEPFYVTIFTQKGVTQDIRFIPIEKRAEPVVLEYEESLPSPATVRATVQENCAALLTQFIQGKLPPEFIPMDSREVSRGKGPVTAMLEKAWGSSQYKVLVFSIKNDSDDKQHLTNGMFWAYGDIASAFNHTVLEPQQTAKLFVIQQRIQG